MRIGLIVPGFSANATDWCIPALRNFVRCLATSDEVHVLTLRYPRPASHYELFGAHVTAMGGGDRRGFGSVDLWRRALSVVVTEHRRRPFDVLHAFWATESGMLAAFAGRILGVPTVVSIAGGELVGFRDLGYGDQLVRRERLKVGLALRLADVVTAGSTYLLGLARPWIGSHRSNQLQRAPLGVDIQLFRPRPDRSRPGLRSVIHVASLVPVKDQQSLLHAIAQLRSQNHDVRLEIAGSGPLEPGLRMLARDLGITPAVGFRGEVRHDILPSFYQSGDAFVLSSRHEAQSLAALEAAACGTPVVGTAVGIVPELAPEAALSVPVGDPGVLARAIGEILSDSACRRSMAEAARARVECSFSVEQCVARFRAIYRQLDHRPCSDP